MKEKILYVHPYNNYTGSTKVLADVLKSKYNDLSKVTVMTDNSQEGFLSGLGLNLVSIPIIKHDNRAVPIISQIVWVIVGFFKVLSYCTKYDCVYINTILPGFAAIAAKCMGKKVIYHIHEKWILPNYKSKFGEFILNNVKAHHIFVSKYLQKQYLTIYSPDDEISYNKLGVDFLNKVEVVPLENHHRNHVIMLASLNKMKGIDTFINVAKVMSDFKFTLIISSSMDKINEYFRGNIPANVELLGRQSNIHPFLKNADFLLNLSDPAMCVETFGMTIIEGMAYGLPAIVPNAGGPTELVKNGVNGYCINVVNIFEIVETLRKCSPIEIYANLYRNALLEVKKFTYDAK